MGPPWAEQDVGLAEALRQAVLAQHFEDTPDPCNGGRAIAHFPSLDLAVVAFPQHGGPVAANVLFSREHPQGQIAHIATAGAGFGSVQGLRFDADQRDAQGRSAAWLPQADWAQMAWQPLWPKAGSDGSAAAPAAAAVEAGTAAAAAATAAAAPASARFVAPYPASLLKVMVAIGVGMAVDAGRAQWDERLPSGRTPASAVADMISFSCNDATTDGVALLHRCDMLHALHQAFAERGLHTLRLDDTAADGGWGNAAGAGVGHIHMTAWDTARLFWLLDEQAPAPAWLPAGTTPLLSAGSHAHVMRALAAQGLHEILSSTALAGVPGFVRGLPAHMPAHWLHADGTAQVGEALFPAGIAAESARAEVRFWHKTGTTENYASDGGIVYGMGAARRHYIVVLLTSLGSRYATHPVCASTWKLPALGAAIDATLARRLEPA